MGCFNGGFRSRIARELGIVAACYRVAVSGKTYVINPLVNQEQVKGVEGVITVYIACDYSVNIKLLIDDAALYRLVIGKRYFAVAVGIASVDFTKGISFCSANA